MEIEVTKSERVRFKNEADRDKYLDDVYPNRVKEEFATGVYWEDSSRRTKITVIWNTIEIDGQPIRFHY